MEVDKSKKLLNTMNALTNYIVITNYDIILPIQIACLVSPCCDTPGTVLPLCQMPTVILCKDAVKVFTKWWRAAPHGRKVGHNIGVNTFSERDDNFDYDLDA